MFRKPRILFLLALLTTVVPVGAQKNSASILPYDSIGKRVIYTGTEQIEIRSRKKIRSKMREWITTRQDFPPMVFSEISSSRDSIVTRAVTEVPSVKNTHSISFIFVLVSHRKSFDYRAFNFKFEDINVSLEDWLNKYAGKGNDRNLKNVDLISRGIDSHVFLSVKNLSDWLNKK